MRFCLFLLLCFIPGLCISCGSETARARETRRPDVLLLMIDTLRADHLGCYGYPRATSPGLDALAREGVRMANVTSQAPWTLPSVSSLLTGRYLTSHQECPDPDAPTMAEVFQRAGYHTLGVVANFVILNDVGFERGFDTFLTRHYTNARGIQRKRPGGTFEDVVSWVRDDLRALASQEDRPPLFFYLHVVDPHDSYEQHPEYNQILPMGTVPDVEPPGWWRKTMAALGAPPPEDDPGWEHAFDRMHRARGCYDREIRYVDESFTALLAELEELGLRENLLIAVVADHGEELWEHLAPVGPDVQRTFPPEKLFFQTHGYLLTEPSLRTPFILSGPGVPAGRTIEEPVENIDLFPTLLELCDIGIDFDLDGTSLVPWMRRPDAAGELRGHTFAYVQHGMVVREEASGLKLILPTEKGVSLGIRPALYDLGSDPRERQNLYARRPEDVDRLTGIQLEHLEAYAREEQVVAGEAGERLRDALQAFGYAGEMVRAGEEEGDSSPAAAEIPDESDAADGD